MQSFAVSERVAALNNEGITALKNKNYVLASKKFLECLRLDPSFKTAKKELTDCYISWGALLQNSPEKAVEKYHKALFYCLDNAIAAEQLRVAIRKTGEDPDRYKTRVERAKRCSLAGDREGGIVELAMALKIKDDTPLRIELGKMYYKFGLLDDAMSEWSTASKKTNIDRQSKSDIYKCLGQAYQAKKEFRHSGEAYKNAQERGWDKAEAIEANRKLWTEAVKDDPLNDSYHEKLDEAFNAR